MKFKKLLLCGIALVAVSASAQELKSGYINWGPGSSDFATTLSTWTKGSQVTEDDNFFISRIKPRERFRNAQTQVNPLLTAANDKKLLAWLPVNSSSKNALPDGVFDSEVFTMWPYVTHWGDWTASLGRIPGAFLDVAHKNGVAVSGVASIPWGNINTQPNWMNFLNTLPNYTEKAAQFFKYYGIDGMGYNSEFTGGYSYMSKIRNFHANLVKEMRKVNPLFENIWYDGTNDNGVIQYDLGLYTHNDDNFGNGDNVRTSLFFNYNWNSDALLSSSATYARTINRSPLDLYAGVNMQGGQPSGTSWTLLKDYPISVGLWGAHSTNMFWESRGEYGSAPELNQRAYMLRTERWFTGGTRNPANCPTVINSMKYNADNVNFHGMSSFMTARSSLKWDLAEEPFITYFNIGNGKFFNWKGKQENALEWYNVGVQDYLPTWRWWFSNGLLTTNVPSSGLDAEFVWDDAYVGGSTARIYGSAADEYLHLFKTDFALQAGDVITFRYKVTKGKADVNLVLTTVNNEKVAVDENAMSLLTASQETDEDVWEERSFTVGSSLNGKELALVALHFQNAEDLNIYLGEFSIVRGAAATPAKPTVTKTQVLSYTRAGYDGKIIFEMPNDKATGEPCYNLDVKTAFFKLWAQQEGCEPVFMGITTSWAGMFYSAPLDLNTTTRNVRFGVSATSLDHKSDSEIAWGEYLEPGTYIYNDDVQIDKSTIKPNEEFTMSFVDPAHEDATWTLLDIAGNTVFSATGHTVTCPGLPDIGSYNLRVRGPHYNSAGTSRPNTSRTFASFVQITSEGVGALPRILSLTGNGEEADITVEQNEEVALAYTGRKADGSGSQGVNMAEQRFGATCADLGIANKQPFTVAFWLKLNKVQEGTQLFSVVNKNDGWPLTDWGWVWSTIGGSGNLGWITFRNSTQAENPPAVVYKYDNTKLPVGNWVHLALAVDFNSSGQMHFELYINGEKETPSGGRVNGTDTSGDPGYQNFTYVIDDYDVLAIGGTAHGRVGIDGVIDNFQVWKKAITAEEAKLSMGDLNPGSLPSGLTYFWDLESAAEGTKFMSVGSGSSIPCGLHTYYASGGEGQGIIEWQAPEYTSGCPFISGTAYPVVTKPEWTAKKGVVTESEGNDLAGGAKVKYAKGGDYSVTLTLANSLGSDSKTFSVIKVDATDAIGSVADTEMKAYTVGEDVFVDFAETGNYGVALYTIDGRCIVQKSVTVGGKEKVRIHAPQQGVYILRVEKDGKTVRSAKLLRK